MLPCQDSINNTQRNTVQLELEHDIAEQRPLRASHPAGTSKSPGYTYLTRREGGSSAPSLRPHTKTRFEAPRRSITTTPPIEPPVCRRHRTVYRIQSVPAPYVRTYIHGRQSTMGIPDMTTSWEGQKHHASVGSVPSAKHMPLARSSPPPSRTRAGEGE